MARPVACGARGVPGRDTAASGAGRVDVARILSSESGLLIAERVLALLRAGGFSAQQAGEVGRYLVCAIITLVRVEPGRGSGDRVRATKAALNALSPQRYPNIVESADVLSSCENPDAYFSRGIDLLVQGASSIAPR